MHYMFFYSSTNNTQQRFIGTSAILLILVSIIGLSNKALAVTKNIYCVNPHDSSDLFWIAHPTRSKIQGEMVRYQLNGEIQYALLISLAAYNQVKQGCGDQYQPQPGKTIEFNWYGFVVRDSERYFLAPAITSNLSIMSNLQVMPELWIEKKLPHTHFNSRIYTRKASFGESLSRSETYFLMFVADTSTTHAPD